MSDLPSLVVAVDVHHIWVICPVIENQKAIISIIRVFIDAFMMQIRTPGAGGINNVVRLQGVTGLVCCDRITDLETILQPVAHSGQAHHTSLQAFPCRTLDSYTIVITADLKLAFL